MPSPACWAGSGGWCGGRPWSCIHVMHDSCAFLLSGWLIDADTNFWQALGKPSTEVSASHPALRGRACKPCWRALRDVHTADGVRQSLPANRRVQLASFRVNRTSVHRSTWQNSELWASQPLVLDMYSICTYLRIQGGSWCPSAFTPGASGWSDRADRPPLRTC